MNTTFSNKIKELTQEYKIYITSLSQIDPFTTYYISNKDIVLDYLGYINNYLEIVEQSLDKPLISKPAPPIEKTWRISFSDIRNKITPFLRETAIETIENDIKTNFEEDWISEVLQDESFF